MPKLKTSKLTPIPKQPAKIKTFGGIDPGQSGGFAIIRGREVYYRPMPSTPHEIKAEMIGLFSDVDFVMMEKVSASPQMGVSSAFTFGRGYGGLEQALAFLEVPYNLVTPQVWQGALGIPKKAKDDPQSVHKEKLRATAQMIFPKLGVWQGTLALQRSVCDALLIAHYCNQLNK